MDENFIEIEVSRLESSLNFRIWGKILEFDWIFCSLETFGRKKGFSQGSIWIWICKKENLIYEKRKKKTREKFLKFMKIFTRIC